MSGERAPRLRLFDILNAIAGIDRALGGKTYQDFQNSDLLQRAVDRWLEIISEASRHLPDEWKASAPEIPWRVVHDFGNVARHVYQAVSARRIWQTVDEDLMPLKVACGRLYAAAKFPADPWPDATPK